QQSRWIGRTRGVGRVCSWAGIRGNPRDGNRGPIPATSALRRRSTERADWPPDGTTGPARLDGRRSGGPASRPDPPQPGGLMIPLPLHLNHTLSITVPLHFRYLPPIVDSKTLPLQEVFITPPSLAKWCNQTTAARSDPNLTPATIKLLSKTFSAHHLSLEALHAADSHPSTPIRLTVPVGVQDDELLVQIITAAAVWMAFAWICSCLVPKHSSLKLNPRPDTKESSAH
ncbi:hypothetical protein KEM48_009965, partial [Puccinia striiformis f. sp. tritici PST-130]